MNNTKIQNVYILKRIKYLLKYLNGISADFSKLKRRYTDKLFKQIFCECVYIFLAPSLYWVQFEKDFIVHFYPVHQISMYNAEYER
jgi:hypothetical protein